MIRLDGIGHVLLRVSDVERSRAFYSTILGLKVVEEDPEHGGVFMALEGQGHTVDLFPVQNLRNGPARRAGRCGRSSRRLSRAERGRAGGCLLHLARARDSDRPRRDHVSQKSIYFHDPDGNYLEIYYELPNAPELFREGRHDRDQPLVFEKRASV